MSIVNKKWNEITWVAFDTETTGKYPLESEICEIAAVKWKNGQIIEEYQQLIKPSSPMGQTVIDIHHITNEMVAEAPRVDEVISDFYNFIKDTAIVAHHAPFDMGFLAIEFENKGLELPDVPVFCTSLLSRKIFPQSPNHRLQTLVDFFGLPKGQAHRALYDAETCLGVAIKCFEKVGEDYTLGQLQSLQGSSLEWSQYSVKMLLQNSKWTALVNAIKNKKDVTIVYEGGSRPGKERVIKPIGIVRSPNGDFLVAFSEGEEHSKRYFLDKISLSR